MNAMHQLVRQCRTTQWHQPAHSRSGFTLIELLVVIGIIALLIGILLPSLSKARESGRDVKCKSNMRGLAQALSAYTNDYKGQFPTNMFDAPERDTGKFSMMWHDVARIGQYLPTIDDANIVETNTRSQTVGGGIMICPNHPEGGRSYAMNYWASSADQWNTTSGPVRGFKPGFTNTGLANPAWQGRAFDATVAFADKMMLMTEAWGLFSSDQSGPGQVNESKRKWYAVADTGKWGFPSTRFNGGLGMSATSTIFPGDWFGNAPELRAATNPSQLNRYIPWYRHPRNRDDTLSRQGGANFAFVDGHVAGLKLSDVVEVQGNQSRTTLRALWSTRDTELTGLY
jgi:prepilin-type N-terminal cleavage/methylation domain-containing protein/prepilin-type processing-associated H-X9-DG protein